MTFDAWSTHHDRACKLLAEYARATGLPYSDVLDIMGSGIILGQLYSWEHDAEQEQKRSSKIVETLSALVSKKVQQ